MRYAMILLSSTTTALLLNSCGKTVQDVVPEIKQQPHNTSKLHRLASIEKDWTWYVDVRVSNHKLHNDFYKGYPKEIKHHQVFIDSDNDITTGYTGSNGWEINGADYIIEDNQIYKSISNSSWKWRYIGKFQELKYLKGTTKQEIMMGQADFDFNSIFQKDNFKVMIELYDKNWGGNYSTITNIEAKTTKVVKPRDSDGDGVSDEDEIRHNTDIHDANSFPKDLLEITDDETNSTLLQARRLEFYPKNTHGIIRTTHNMWAQGLAYLDNETYLVSQNLYEKNPDTNKVTETYTLFNLLDKDGKSIGNIQLDYKSHAQGLSVQKINDTLYHIYTVSSDGLSISKFIFDISNIDFNHIDYHANIPLNIKFSTKLNLPNVGTSITPSLNVEKDKFVTIGYVANNFLKIHSIDKKSLEVLKTYDFSLSFDSNGYYNQGAAMKNDIVYLVRGHWRNEDKKAIKRLFVIDLKKNKLIASYSFSLKNISDFYITEPEGVTIINNELFLQLPTRETKDAESKRRLRLYKLIDTLPPTKYP